MTSPRASGLASRVPLRTLGLGLVATVAGCWIVAGTEDFGPETTPSTSTLTSSAGGSTTNSAAGANGGSGTAMQGGGGGGSSQGGGGAGGCNCAPNEVCVNALCHCGTIVSTQQNQPVCKGAYPICNPNAAWTNGMGLCGCTGGSNDSCTNGFVCDQNSVPPACRCDNDTDCYSVPSAQQRCNNTTGVCECLSGVCLSTGHKCDNNAGASCECIEPGYTFSEQKKCQAP